jgi:hypothetical protein
LSPPPALAGTLPATSYAPARRRLPPGFGAGTRDHVALRSTTVRPKSTPRFLAPRPRNVTATFFFLGYYAEQRPELGRDIVDAATRSLHGYTHRRLFRSPWSTYDDLARGGTPSATSPAEPRSGTGLPTVC